ncbi:hypothetical protein AAC387_Pa12g0311 [Persea americana]
MQASELHLPQADPSLVVSSLLFEPISHSLALVRSDSSLLLYPPFSSFPPSSPPTIIPPLSTTFSFLRFHPNPNPNSASRVIFLTARPHAAGSSILLRAWILTSANSFAPICLDFNGKHGASSAAVIGLSHGFSVKIEGSVNFFALYSASARKIWVLSVRLRDDRTCLDLMKCAVIDCTSPIYSLRVSMGLLLLGEVNGVRVFPMRLLVKGRVKKRRNMEGRSENDNLSPKSDDLHKKQMDSSLKDMGGCCNGGGIELEGTAEISSPVCKGGHRADYSLAIRNIVKLRQDSGDLGSFFVAFKCLEVQSRNGLQTVTASLKAVSIHSLSQQRFLILDSNGVLHLFSMHNTTIDSEVSTRSCIPSRNGRMRRLNYTMKVQMLAVHPDIASRTYTIWISDGCYSVHIMSFTDVDISADESNNDGSDRKIMQNSVAVQAIFTSEKVQDIIPYAANGVLILGQGSIFAYGIA